MFKIIEQLSSPIKFPAEDGGRFCAGQIVRLVRTEDDVYCSLANCKESFGIVTGPVDELGFVPVLSTGSAIILTDLFEETLEYKSGVLLYSNNSGLLTTRKLDTNSTLLAYVIAANTEGRDYIEINWI